MEFRPENLRSLRPLAGDGSKLYIETYGCQMNAGDSEIVLLSSKTMATVTPSASKKPT